MLQRTWFITGISSGLGRHMTEQLLEHGDRVAGTARKLAAVDDLKAQYGDRLWLASLDVTDTPAVHRVVGEAFAAMGRIDVIVNNAGYGLFRCRGRGQRRADSASARHKRHRLNPGHPRRPPAPAGSTWRADHAGLVRGWTDHLSEFQPVSHEQMGH